jgi:hypothetical protein
MSEEEAVRKIVLLGVDEEEARVQSRMRERLHTLPRRESPSAADLAILLASIFVVTFLAVGLLL